MPDQPTLAEWLQQGPWTLTMSSGFFGFFAHCGVLNVLEEQDLLPAAASGSSAGALTTGVWASGRETGWMAERLLDIQRRDFWDPRPGRGLLRGGKFRRLLEEVLEAPDFAGCRLPLRISIYDTASRDTRIVTDGELAPAIQASCAVPLMFHPVSVNGQASLDGGIRDRPGLAGVPAGERVLYHHLVSRSPWTRAPGYNTALPVREDMTSLVIHGLPRPHPFAMARGRAAYEHARSAMRRALHAPIPASGLVTA